MGKNATFSSATASGGLGSLLAIIIVQVMALCHVAVSAELAVAVATLVSPFIHLAYVRLGVDDPTANK